MTHRRAACGILLLLLSAAAGAHTPGSSQLTVAERNGSVELLTADVAIVDLAQLVAVDGDADGRVRWREAQDAAGEIAALLAQGIELRRGDAACALDARPRELAVVVYGGIPHLSLPLRVHCPDRGSYTLASTLLFGLDPRHRSVVRIEGDGRQELAVLTRDDPALTFAAGQRLGVSAMVYEGIRHILAGYDHLLFLLLLILPAVDARGARRSLLRLAGIVSAFTLAHSITLALAATGVVTLPGRPVEIAIAASIVAAAALNMLRPGHRIGWQLAFGFGLLHGFGFAGALAELGLGADALFRNLLAFNVGVELGQLAVVAAALPLLALLTLWPHYRRFLVPSLSAAGAGLGLVWTVARL